MPLIPQVTLMPPSDVTGASEPPLMFASGIGAQFIAPSSSPKSCPMSPQKTNKFGNRQRVKSECCQFDISSFFPLKTTKSDNITKAGVKSENSLIDPSVISLAKETKNTKESNFLTQFKTENIWNDFPVPTLTDNSNGNDLGWKNNNNRPRFQSESVSVESSGRNSANFGNVGDGSSKKRESKPSDDSFFASSLPAKTSFPLKDNLDSQFNPFDSVPPLLSFGNRPKRNAERKSETESHVPFEKPNFGSQITSNEESNSAEPSASSKAFDCLSLTGMGSSELVVVCTEWCVSLNRKNYLQLTHKTPIKGT